jgi:hypothetical protein
MGLDRGDRVGWIRTDPRVPPTWAHLAGLRIVAEIGGLHAGEYWGAPAATREAVLRRFAEVGVRAIVASPVPDGAAIDGWVRLGETGHAVILLPALPARPGESRPRA